MKHVTKTLLRSVLVAGRALPGTAAALGADDAADVAAIQDLWRSSETLVVAGDAETWIGLQDQEGIQMPPGEPMHSHAELVEMAKTWTAAGADAMSVLPMETVILGDMSRPMGTYTPDVTASELPGRLDGKFMTLLRRQDDGAWKSHRDIYNMNAL